MTVQFQQVSNSGDCGCEKTDTSYMQAFVNDNVVLVHLDGDEESLDQQVMAIRDAWNKLCYPPKPADMPMPATPAMEGYIREVFEDHIIVEKGDGLFWADYTKDDAGNIVFEDKTT